MPPTPLNRLAKAIRMLLSKYNSYSLSSKSKKRFTLHPKKKNSKIKNLHISNPFQTMFKGLSSTLSQITKKPTREDYNAIVNRFLPGNAKLLIPQHPANSGGIQFLDLDGESRNGLIASYKLNDEVKTIILKKQSEQWQKAAEINNSKYDAVSYRGVADLTGEGKKQLLLGMVSEGKVPTLYGYSMENNTLKEIFNRNYHRFEVLNLNKNRNAVTKSQLAVWNKKDADAYNIEVLDWNGSQFEPLKDTASYYYKKVVPYYARKVKLKPYDPSNWYNLTDALIKTGVHRDAQMAVEFGIAQSPNSEWKEKFLALRSGIIGK